MASKDVKDAIERAIKMEENSYNLYASASKRVKDPGAKAGLKELAGEEKKHKAKLEGMLAGDLEWTVSVGRKAKPKDLKIGAVVESKPITESSDFQAVLAFAIKREEQSGTFYNQMAALAEPGAVKRTFEMLAKEEAQHKEYLESIYEQDVYQAF
jgi:rubrerythrin